MTRLVILFVLALTTFAAAQTTRSETDAELERSLEILRRLDETLVSVVYVDMPLEEVIEDLNWFADVPLTADWESLLTLGVDAETEVSLRLEDTPLSTVLAAVALRLGTDFDRPRVEVFRAGMLVLTSEEATKRMRLTDVYDVRDLLADGRAVTALQRTAPSRAADVEVAEGADDEGDDEDEVDPIGSTAPEEDPDAPPVISRPGWRIPPRGDSDGSAPTAAPRRADPPSAGVELMTLICEHVDPDAWIEYGGTRAAISERDGVLLVSAAPSVHRRMRDTLRRLRRVYASRITFDAAIIDVPRAEFDRLNRRYESASVALGRALLAADDAVVLWRTSAPAALNEPASFTSKGETGVVTLELLPRLDRTTGLLHLGLKAESRRGPDERTVETSVTIPSRNGGAVIELPPSTAGATARLIVLIPQRN